MFPNKETSIFVETFIELTEKFKVQFLEDAAEFLKGLDNKAREKVIYNIRKAQITSDKELFKKLTNEIWEFRTLFNKTHYRLFAFWDKTDRVDTIVISTHGLIKRSDKTPQGDLDKADRLRKLYLEQKTHKK